MEVLKYITSLSGLKMKIDPYAVSIVPQGVATEQLITKEFKVSPGFISSTPSSEGGSSLNAPSASSRSSSSSSSSSSGIARRQQAKEFLEANGIQFPAGASANFIPASSKLIVRNTQDQLDLIETLVESTQVGPTQVEIEAKFVEVTQNNLKELSFDWLLGGFNVGGNRVFGSGGTTGQGRTLNNANFPFVAPGANTPVGSNPITAGDRTGSGAISANAIDALLFPTAGSTTAAPGIFAISGVFTDPQFQVVYRALNQKKGVDLLSAPRVTTKSGQRATIEIIREFRYPTEFNPPQIPQSVGGGNSGGGLGGGSVTSEIPVTPTTPTAFETRNVGVTLEVEPVVGGDGATIDLNLVPQVTEFEGFINYGSPILRAPKQGFIDSLTGLFVPGTGETVVTPNVINQPIFSTRKVTTSVSIWDNSTVVLGGLMREDVQKVEDKVPFLGDLPLAGRLFRSSVDQHIKRNLVIFVSARLINAAGEPVNLDEEKEEVVEPLNPPLSTAPAGGLPEALPPALPR
jgi:general secretion pathway protein D